MSDSMLGDDPLQTARALQAALEGMTKQLAGVQATVRRGKVAIAALGASLVLDLILTVIVSVTAIQAHDASTRANATVSDLRAIQVASCEAGNQTRAQEVALWTHLADISTTPKTTPVQRAADAKLLAYIRSVFRAKDCQSLYRLRVPG